MPARLVGINVDLSVWVAFIVSGGLAGIAGALLTSTLGAGDPTAALSYLFPAFADINLPVISAEFERDGDPRGTATESVLSAEDAITLTW